MLRLFALFCIVLTFGASRVAELPHRNEPAPVQDDGCLTPEQDDQLQQAITIIEDTLNTAIAAMKVAEIFEHDPQTKQNLEEAIEIMQVINQEVEDNLQRIVDETCGTCLEITYAVEDIVNTIEETLTEIEPDWENDPIFQVVVEAIQLILDITKAVCPSDTSVVPVADGCLTPEQDQTLDRTIRVIEDAINVAVSVMQLVEDHSQDATKQANLAEAIEVLNVINQEIDDNLKRIVDESCGTCLEITMAVEDIISTVEDTLNQIDPDWENNQVLKVIEEALQLLVDVGKLVCKESDIVFHPLDSCLTPEQDQQLEEATQKIDKLLSTTVTALKVAAFTEKDPQTKENLELAITIIETVDNEIVGNLTRIADETCGTCLEITLAVEDIIQILEDSLTQIEPDWENDPIYQLVVESIQLILDITKLICPSALLKFEHLFTSWWH